MTVVSFLLFVLSSSPLRFLAPCLPVRTAVVVSLSPPALLLSLALSHVALDGLVSGFAFLSPSVFAFPVVRVAV